MAGTFSHRGMLGFDTVATKSHHQQPVNATTLVLGWKLVTALGIAIVELADWELRNITVNHPFYLKNTRLRMGKPKGLGFRNDVTDDRLPYSL